MPLSVHGAGGVPVSVQPVTKLSSLPGGQARRDAPTREVAATGPPCDEGAPGGAWCSRWHTVTLLGETQQAGCGARLQLLAK